MIAAAVDIVGVLVNLTALPILASGPDRTVFQALENLANALTNVAAFGLYSAASLLLLPGIFATPNYPRRFACLATLPLLAGFGLFAPWAWANDPWLLRRKPAAQSSV